MNRAFASAWLLASLAFAGAAHGQVYKCTGADGKLAYQSEPCDGGKTLSPAPPRAPTAAPDKGEQLGKIVECANLSKAIEEILRYRASYLMPQDNAKINAFRRDCQSLGFRYPDSNASIEHNKARTSEAMNEFMRLNLRSAPEPAAPVKAQADPLDKAGRCVDLARAIESSLRGGKSYEGDGAARIVEFRSDCQKIGYRFPDTRENVEYNRGHFHELLKQRAEGARR